MWKLRKRKSNKNRVRMTTWIFEGVTHVGDVRDTTFCNCHNALRCIALLEAFVGSFDMSFGIIGNGKRFAAAK